MRYHDRILRALRRERAILQRQVQEARAAGRDASELARDLLAFDENIDVVEVVCRVLDRNESEPWRSE